MAADGDDTRAVAPTGPSAHPGGRRQLRRTAFTAVSIVWALLPIATLGFAAPFTMAYAAFRLRTKAMAWCAAGYAVAFVLGFVASGSSDSDTNLLGNIGTAVIVVAGALATAQSCVIRSRVFASGEVDRSVEEGRERMRRRVEARRILADDPALARELQIGRPDRARTYDDGGLVDVNHVGPDHLAAVPGLDRALAELIVSTRDEVGGFTSVDDVSVTLGLAPQALDEASSRLVFLP